MCENRKIIEKTILNQFPPKSILKHYGEMGCCDADPQVCFQEVKKLRCGGKLLV